MKRQILIIGSILFLIGCKKEQHPPIELLGNWKMVYKKHKIYDAGGIITWTDTITTNNKKFEFFDNWKVKTNKYFPNCTGDFQLSEGNKKINISFECNTVLLDYSILSNTTDTLIMEKDDGIDIYQEIYLRY